MRQIGNAGLEALLPYVSTQRFRIPTTAVGCHYTMSLQLFGSVCQRTLMAADIAEQPAYMIRIMLHFEFSPPYRVCH